MGKGIIQIKQTAASGGGGVTSLTTNGTSGASTLVGTTLNVPVYASSSAGTTPVTTKVHLTSANILGLGTAFELLSILPIGQIYGSMLVHGRINAGATPYDTSTALGIIDTTTGNLLFIDGSGGLGIEKGILLLATGNTTARFIESLVGSNGLPITPGGSISIICPDGNPLNGNGTLDIYCTYTIITL